MPSRLQTQLEIKEISESDGTFSGFGGVYGNIDSDRDIVAKGAFNESLNKGRTPKMLFQHRPDQLAGKWTKIEDREQGLYVEGQLNLDKQLGRDIYSDLKFGALDAMSVGFQTIEDEFDRNSGIRTITKANLWEVSLVTFPANDQARISMVKTASHIVTIRDLETTLRDAGFSKKEALAVASRFIEKETDTGRDASAELDEIKNAILQLNDKIKGNL